MKENNSAKVEETPISLLDTVIRSCEEGKDGTWDTSTDEGKEGFDAMIDLLERVKRKLETPPHTVEGSDEPQFWGQNLDEGNVADLQKWVDDDVMDGLVDETQGGIIAYVHRNHVNRIADLLNKSTMPTPHAVEGREEFTPGEWKVENYNYRANKGYETPVVVTENGRKSCCIGFIWGNTKKMSISNAALIASAPRLYRENKELVKQRDLAVNELSLMVKQDQKKEAENKELREALGMVLTEWHSNKKNFTRKEVPHIQKIRLLLNR